MTADEREHALTRLRAMMAHTVANGCTPNEELAAARQIGRLIVQIDGADLPPDTPYSLGDERQSPDYQIQLEKSTLEGLFKSAVQELSLGHINTLSPPRQLPPGQKVEWVGVADMLQGHLSMALGISGSRLGRELLAVAIEELIQDGMLPDRLAVPVGP